MTTLKHDLITLDQHADTDFRRQALQHILLPLIQQARVLDAGCGMGFMSRRLSAKGCAVVATDIEYEFVANAVANSIPHTGSVRGVVSADGRFPFADASYHTILSLDVIEHIADDAQVLREFARMLQADGKLILTVPALSFLYGKRDVEIGHYRRYTKSMLRERLVAAGFVVERIHYWNMLGVLPYFLAERIFQRPISDTIRQGQPTRTRQWLALLIKRWLVAEWAIAPALPLGLSLVVVARPQ
jgi:2-polyprenyl-3-methyl-5-hydroxy-6-metoxy-1,4-benzoquinol methylase